ncbi:hypothetical protein Ahy_B08g089854 [Arachis hypogaea]|uniref:Aminotransferase-like plant mobile domain-containing protein n=1 Tax=Arachis hypogaea TaxID=3818 RepID=A0A444XZ11_ARAHY|nr:hypothetical protein Ahy_B08g089854 [Arachis hypogaea]
MPSTDDTETLRQYARYYILLFIGGYLMMDKSNNLVHLHWLPPLQDFGRCRALSWDSTIYQEFSQWCPPDRKIFMYPMAARGGRLGDMDVSHPLVCLNIIEFHEVDRVKRQFNGEQPVPGTPVNVDGFLTSTGRDKDVWWPERLAEWCDGWTSRFEEGRKISIQYCVDYRPTREY